MKRNYSTSLTDSQYDTILRIIGDKRKRQRSLRGVLNALFHLLKTGCQWRMLPSDFPNWERVYYYFQKWSRYGTIEEIHEVLRRRVRLKRGRNESPSVAIIFIERFWRTVKYEYLYIRSFDDGAALYRGLAVFMGYYNERRTHQSLARGVTPSMRYKGFFGESSKTGSRKLNSKQKSQNNWSEKREVAYSNADKYYDEYSIKNNIESIIDAKNKIYGQ